MQLAYTAPEMSAVMVHDCDQMFATFCDAPRDKRKLTMCMVTSGTQFLVAQKQLMFDSC